MPRMVGEDTSQTLTNKSIDGDVNTVTDVAPAVHTHAESDITGLVSDLAAKLPTSYLDTDTALAANSDVKIASQKAVKAYVDAAVTGLLDFKGSTNASANPNYPAASKGDAYVISVAGKIGGASGKSVEVSDVYLAIADNAGGTEASVGTSWIVLEHNLIGALLASDLDTDGTLAANSDTKIATQKATKTYADTKQPLDTDLTTIAGLTATTDNFIQSKASAWASRTPTQVTADLIAFVGDSGSGGTKGLVPAPASGDAAANKYLKANGSWTAVSAGGQTTYDAIVAPSGGDYTTLGAAITAASAGWSIFVKEGTYSESTITTSLNNLTIVGESPLTSILTIGTTACTFSGTNVQIKNIQFSVSTGRVVHSGNNFFGLNIFYNYTGIPGTTDGVAVSGTDAMIIGCRYENSTTGDAVLPQFNVTGSRASIVGCKFYANARDTNSTRGVLVVNATYSLITGCIFRGRGANGAYGVAVNLRTSYITFSGNIMTDFNVTSNQCAGLFTNQSGNVSITGNTFFYTYAQINASTFTGNNMTLPSVGSTYGLYLDLNGGDTSVISGNYFKIEGGSSTGAILFASGVSDITITNNYFTGWTNAVMINQGNNTNVVISNNNFSNITVPINDASGPNDLQVFGNVGEYQKTKRVVIRVDNDSGGSLAAGDVVVRGTATDVQGVTTTTTAGDNKVLGIALEAISSGATGKVMTEGYTTQLKVDGTTDIAVGDYLSCFTTAKIAKKASAGETAFAIAYEAYTTDNSSGVIDALLIPPRLI